MFEVNVKNVTEQEEEQLEFGVLITVIIVLEYYICKKRLKV